MKESMEEVINIIKKSLSQKSFPIVSLSVIGKHSKSLSVRNYTLIEDLDLLLILEKVSPEFLNFVKTLSDDIRKYIFQKSKITVCYEMKGGPVKIYRKEPTILLHWLIFDISHYKKLSPLLHNSINKSHRLLMGISPKKICKVNGITIGDVLYVPEGILFYKEMVKKGVVINSLWRRKKDTLQLEICKKKVKDQKFFVDICCSAVLKSYKNLYEASRKVEKLRKELSSKTLLKEIETFKSIKMKLRNGEELSKKEIIQTRKKALKVLEMLEKIGIMLESLENDKKEHREKYYI